jgi:hypothetical protein
MIGLVLEVGYFALVLLKYTWPVFFIAVLGGIYDHN